MTHVIDSSVLLVYLLEGRGGDVLLEPKRCNHLSLINLAEVYTKVLDQGGAIEECRCRGLRPAHPHTGVSLSARR